MIVHSITTTPKFRNLNRRLTNRLRLFIGLLLVVFLGNSVSAQEYDHSLGVRLALTSGIAYKGSINRVSAIEVIVSSKQRADALTAMYQFHLSGFSNRNLYWVLGAGGHLGSIKPVKGTPTLIAGFDAVAGIEYALPRGPFAFTLDVKPALNLIGRQSLDIGWFGLTGRYTF